MRTAVTLLLSAASGPERLMPPLTSVVDAHGTTWSMQGPANPATGLFVLLQNGAGVSSVFLGHFDGVRFAVKWANGAWFDASAGFVEIADPTGGEPPPPPPGLVAEFSTTPQCGLAVQFTDQSTGGASVWVWDFGDGGVSTAQHPVHTYAAAGSYAVVLTINGGAATKTRTVLVSDSSPAVLAWTNAPAIEFMEGVPVRVPVRDYLMGSAKPLATITLASVARSDLASFGLAWDEAADEIVYDGRMVGATPQAPVDLGDTYVFTATA